MSDENLRDKAALAALTGLLANEVSGDWDVEATVRAAYQLAEALVKAKYGDV